MREYRFCFNVFPDPPVQAFHNISRIDDLSDFQWIIEELNQVFPVVLPRSDGICILKSQLHFKSSFLATFLVELHLVESVKQKSYTIELNRSGFSRLLSCPAPEMTSSFAPGIASRI